MLNCISFTFSPGSPRGPWIPWMPMPFAPCKANSIWLKLCVFSADFSEKTWIRTFSPLWPGEPGTPSMPIGPGNPAIPYEGSDVCQRGGGNGCKCWLILLVCNCMSLHLSPSLLCLLSLPASRVNPLKNIRRVTRSNRLKRPQRKFWFTYFFTRVSRISLKRKTTKINSRFSSDCLCVTFSRVIIH